MARVVLSNETASRFSNGVTVIELPREANSVRRVISELEQRFPGIGETLRGAVSINGEIYQNCLFEPVPDDAEVCFMPSIEGG